MTAETMTTEHDLLIGIADQYRYRLSLRQENIIDRIQRRLRNFPGRSRYLLHDEQRVMGELRRKFEFELAKAIKQQSPMAEETRKLCEKARTLLGTRPSQNLAVFAAAPLKLNRG